MDLLSNSINFRPQLYMSTAVIHKPIINSNTDGSEPRESLKEKQHRVNKNNIMHCSKPGAQRDKLNEHFTTTSLTLGSLGDTKLFYF